MLATAITLLVALTGVIAAAVVCDSLVAARAAWVRLMREGEVMRAGLSVQASARAISLRPAAAPRRVMAGRASVSRQPRQLQACVAA